MILHFITLLTPFLLILSCQVESPETKGNQTTGYNQIPDSLILITQEKIFATYDTIEILVAENKTHTSKYEFWFRNHQCIHFVKYPDYEINYSWITNLDHDADLEIIRAQGYEDGVDYGVYEVRGNKEKLLFYFMPALQDERYPDKLFWGYPQDMESIIVNDKKEILSSLCTPNTRDDNFSTLANQKIIPYLFFRGKTTQPEMTITYNGIKQEYLSLSNLSSSLFEKIDISRDYSIPSDYYIHKENHISQKADKNTFSILALEKQSEKNNKCNCHFGLPIVILKNNKFLEQNDNIVFKYDDNCPSDGFDGIVCKDNYFTIEQVFCSDFLFVRGYITFKIDEKTDQIVLHKYGETYADRSNPDREIPEKVWTTKDFGKVLFKDFSKKMIIDLRQN